MRHVAIVTGSRGRLGRAFACRLVQGDFEVQEVDVGETHHRAPSSGERLYLFDFAYEHGEPLRHVERVAAHLVNWRRYEAIFVPSSMWISPDHPYGRAKMAVEHLAALYIAEGARVFTDRIGYFPGDGIEPDPDEPFYQHRVTGDALYARVMDMMFPVEAGDEAMVGEPLPYRLKLKAM